MDSEAVVPIRRTEIEYCSKHRTELEAGMVDGGLLDSYDLEVMMNPLFEGFTLITLSAIRFFGPEVILERYSGCPACAFGDVVGHIVEAMVRKYKEPK